MSMRRVLTVEHRRPHWQPASPAQCMQYNLTHDDGGVSLSLVVTILSELLKGKAHSATN